MNYSFCQFIRVQVSVQVSAQVNVQVSAQVTAQVSAQVSAQVNVQVSAQSRFNVTVFVALSDVKRVNEQRVSQRREGSDYGVPEVMSWAYLYLTTTTTTTTTTAAAAAANTEY
jgi:hypothetical protein